VSAELPIVRPMPVTALLDDAVARFGDCGAMDFLGRRWNYRQLGEAVEHVARGLQDIGVVKGTRVGLCLPNTPYTVICFFAILRAGGTVVNFNPLYVERELLFQIRDSNTEIMITIDVAMVLNKVQAMAAEGGLRRIVVCKLAAAMPFLTGLGYRLISQRAIAATPNDKLHTPYSRLLAARGKPKRHDVDPLRDIAVLQYTGGTTGTPKGAMLTHANVVSNGQQLLAANAPMYPGVERFLAVLPLFHVFALTTCLTVPVMMGGEIVLLPRFEMKQFLAAIARTKPTVMPAVPTLFTALVNLPDLEKYDLGHIRLCISGGAAIPIEVLELFERRTGRQIIEGYGLSETSPIVSFNLPGAVKEGTVGRPLPQTEVQIRDPIDHHKVLGAGARGEVCVRGPQVMAGYWNRPDETANVTVDGFLRTGDVGFIDSDGYLTLVDRLKEVIICGGYNVYPRVIEEALYHHPDVAEAAVVGMPDAYRGEAPRAYVVLKPGAHIDDKQMLEYLAGQVSKIEMPREIVFRDSLPKTTIGKVAKRELIAREQAAAEAAALKAKQ
jgi:long-chain acyl-CoA synthetase